MNKKATEILYEVLIHLILIALIFGMFFYVAYMKVDSNGVKQQVLEKQTALMIDSAIPGMKIIINKSYSSDDKTTKISDLKLEGSRVFVYINNLKYSKGYPYFTEHSVNLNSDNEKYYIEVSE